MNDRARSRRGPQEPLRQDFKAISELRQGGDLRVHVFESLGTALLGVERRQQGSPGRTALWTEPGKAPGRQQQNLLPRGEVQPLGHTPERADHERLHDTT
ncbi:hypothetical protein WME97_17155 [Sorangium sp. So ce367]|uniref:hypothetical protein n=1 Tax=Sorangium sp. So ce367 TaxID=3133305 RepID=UPI003F62862B